MSRRSKSKSDDETPSVLKVFGSIDAEEQKGRIRKRKYYQKAKKNQDLSFKTEYSVRAISTPMGNKR